jgi:flagellar assembly protein FliH
MATVISSDNINAHNVNKYNFKVIASGSVGETEQNVVNNREEKEFTQDDNPKKRESDKIDSSALSSSSKESLIESLMKKTDEMSSNFIKLQMKLESKEEEFKIELAKVKEKSFAEGIEAGKAKAMEEGELGRSSAISLFAESVKKLEQSAQEYETALEGIKNNLINAALDISKEVISIELGENSGNIAKILSSELIKELQSASKITLKVNPKDHGTVSEHVGSLSHVEVMSDSAISEGGVVAISDAGNIDSEISKRFEKVKQAAISE